MFPEVVIVPAEVWKEVVEQGHNRPGALLVKQTDWITVKNIKNENLFQILKLDLDNGEAEAIALAKEIDADVILLDERDARKIATQLNINILGTIGILIWAKQHEKIPVLKKVLDSLIYDAGFRISDKLYKMALETVNEL